MMFYSANAAVLRRVVMALVTTLACGSAFGQTAARIVPAPPSVAATAHLLMDARSGKVLAANNEDQRLPPASLTKMMTSYVLSHEIARGNVSPSDMVTVSKNAWAQNPLFAGSSLMWIEVGKQVSIDDLHRGIVISSGNDASLAVAEHLAGSESAFADVMNQHADVLGMSNTHYVNSHGLPDPDHYTTANDLAKLAKAIINDYPQDYEMYSERSFTYNGIRTPNRNSLLGGPLGVDGLKTGHTNAAGYCLVASAEKDGMRLISVVMGTDSTRARKTESSKLLAYGFRFFETPQLYSAGEELQRVKVWSGERDELELGIAKDVYATIPRGAKADIETRLQLPEVFEAPIQAGQEMGRLVLSLDGEVLEELPVVALHGVAEGGFFTRLIDALTLFFYNLFGIQP